LREDNYDHWPPSLWQEGVRVAFIIFQPSNGASKVVMDKLGIGTAFAFDYHFRRFGTVVVVPQ